MKRQSRIIQIVSLFSLRFIKLRDLVRLSFLSVALLIMTSAAAAGTGNFSVLQDTTIADTLAIQVNDTTEQASYHDLDEFIHGIVASQQLEHKLSAIAVSVVQNDSIIFAKGYGWADIESSRPVTAGQTLFRIGSVSKTYTWTAVMILVEEGLLDLDEDVNMYLEEVEIEEAFGEPVTLRQLMSHRAGFEDTMRLFAVADDDSRSLAELLREHQPKRIYPPGKRTSYSNWGSALAAQIVEDVTGTPYKTFLQEEILDPLGLENTLLEVPDNMPQDRRAHLATGYKTDRGALNFQNYMQIGPYWPAGGIAATATDMTRWMQFHLNGGELDGVRLLSSETHQKMWTRAYNDRPHGTDVAHGFQDRPYHGLRLLGHAGGTAAFLTNMILVPELNLGIFLSQNSAETGSLISHFPLLVIDHMIGEAYHPSLIEESDVDELEELAGTYLNNRRVFSTFSAVMGLTSAATLSPVSDNAVVLNALGESNYYVQLPDQPDIFEDAAGLRLSIIRDDRGRVQAFADGMGIHTFERVGFFKNPATFIGAFGLAILLTISTLLGAWRRVGRGKNLGFSSRVAGFASFLAALSVLTLVIGVVFMGISFADFDISQMAENYPSASMFFTHYAGWMVAIMAIVMLLALWPAWTDSGWSMVRRLHFSLYTFVLIVFAIQLWQWRIIGATVI
jgi:CubicO group peptidase (beta-lactamase class C family)